MRQRNSWLFFALTLLTAGLFGPIWIYLMNRDIQKVDPRQFPNLDRIAIVALIYPLLLGAHSYATAEGVSLPVIIALRAVIVMSWLALLWLFFGGIVAVARYVRREVEVPGDIAFLLLTFVLFVSLPILQRSLNALAPSDTRTESTRRVVPDA